MARVVRTMAAHCQKHIEVKILSTMLRWLEGKEEKCPSLKSEQVQQLLKNREYSDCPICHSCSWSSCRSRKKSSSIIPVNSVQLEHLETSLTSSGSQLGVAAVEDCQKPVPGYRSRRRANGRLLIIYLLYETSKEESVLTKK
uniref:Uncharacterized protein n=1 Tax=Magallana gigas TaxID=29159 RepID=K1Q7A4_MAGGI